jgi:hypothetical protein
LVVVTLLAATACGGDSVPRPKADVARSTTTPKPATTPAASPAASSTEEARASVRDFYRAISQRRYAAAWKRLSPRLRRSFGNFEAWQAGYAETVSVSTTALRVDDTGSTRVTVKVDLRAVDRDACSRRVTQRFSGKWQLRFRADRWLADRIRMSKTSGDTPIRDRGACGPPAAATKDVPNASSEAKTPKRRGGSTSTETPTKVCYPTVRLAEVRLAAVDLPATTLPAVTINGHRYPARRIPARRIPARHIPGRTIPGRTIKGRCYAVPTSFTPSRTTVRVSGYEGLDKNYSSDLTKTFWRNVPRAPDPTARGFGELNAAGFPKNQYVRPYVRRDGTVVSGYWRNSPTDGLPTCRVISC